MALRIRFQYPTGSNLGYSIERLTDYTYYDFTTAHFVVAPVVRIAPLPEDTGDFVGRYTTALTTTPANVFTDGDYVITVHDRGAGNAVVAELASTFFQGNDSTVLPSTPGWTSTASPTPTPSVSPTPTPSPGSGSGVPNSGNHTIINLTTSALTIYYYRLSGAPPILTIGAAGPNHVVSVVVNMTLTNLEQLTGLVAAGKILIT